MRDIVAWLIAAGLFVFALGLATSLHWYRGRRDRRRREVLDRGQSILAEVPNDEGIALFTEDEQAFHWDGRAIPKHAIQATRVLINGTPIAVKISTRFPAASDAAPGTFSDRPDGIRRDRWDVAIETPDETVTVECGAIRENVSQDLARRVFEAVKTEIESRDAV